AEGHLLGLENHPHPAPPDLPENVEVAEVGDRRGACPSSPTAAPAAALAPSTSAPPGEKGRRASARARNRPPYSGTSRRSPRRTRAANSSASWLSNTYRSGLDSAMFSSSAVLRTVTPGSPSAA